MFRKTFLPPIADLLAFEAAARHTSISRAADELHFTQGAVSRQIRQLEALLGMALFHRVRQRIVLTDAGRVYAADVRAALQLLSGATQKAMSFSGGGLLNLAVLPTFGTRWLIPRMGRFAAHSPDVVVNFSARSEPFDFALEPFDAAIHFGTPHWAGAVCEYLMHEEVVPLCSPAFQQRHAIGSVAELAGVVLLQQSTRPTQWAEWFDHAGLAVSLQALRGPRFEQFAMIAQAAVSGQGAALLPRFLVEAELASGSLVALFPQALRSTHAYYLVFPESRAEAPLVRVFRDWILGECAWSGSAPDGGCR